MTKSETNKVPLLVSQAFQECTKGLRATKSHTHHY